MAFEEQTLPGLLEARRNVTEALRQHVPKTREMSHTAAFVLQATSDLLQREQKVFAMAVATIIDAPQNSVGTILDRFKTEHKLFTSHEEQTGRTRRHLYLPTDFGWEVCGMFSDLSDVRPTS